MSLKEILEYNFISIGDYQFNLFNLLTLLVIYLVARLFIRLSGKLTVRIFRSGKTRVDEGRILAIQQFIKYFIYTGAVILGLQSAGINLSLLLAGSAALLVGLGLGLQNVFSDLISGIILLIEGSVDVEDTLFVDGLMGKVKRIGLRTTQVETRDGISILVPNSKLIIEKVTNWSHNNDPTRFQVRVGVSYSSDIDLVTSVLLEVADQEAGVLKQPAAGVHFVDFGNSSLDFTLHFYTFDFWNVEGIKSRLRYAIFRKFKEHNISIPFPQRDIWIKSQPEASS